MPPLDLVSGRAAHHDQHPLARGIGQFVHHAAEHEPQLLTGR
jgi:hypothetical protein